MTRKYWDPKSAHMYQQQSQKADQNVKGARYTSLILLLLLLYYYYYYYHYYCYYYYYYYYSVKRLDAMSLNKRTSWGM